MAIKPIENYKKHKDVPGYYNWKNMNARCRATSGKNKVHYADKGISVCEEWLQFENFFKDMGPKPFEKAFELVKDEEEVFIIGGANVYRQGLNYADRLYITEVQAEPEGDILFPEFDKNEWKEIKREKRAKDAENIYDMDFVIYEKIK